MVHGFRQRSIAEEIHCETSTEAWINECFSGIVPIYRMYSFPVIATYGVVTSRLILGGSA